MEADEAPLPPLFGLFVDDLPPPPIPAAPIPAADPIIAKPKRTRRKSSNPRRKPTKSKPKPNPDEPNPNPDEEASANPDEPKKKSRKKKKKKRKRNRSPEPTSIIVVPVYPVRKVVPSSSASTSYTNSKTKPRKPPQPVLTEEQMKDWRCQADDCPVHVSDVGRYYQRHRICPGHSKAPSVICNATEQRYCQQCSRFHELTEFDGSRRSCRRQLCRRRIIRTLTTLSTEEDLQHI